MSKLSINQWDLADRPREKLAEKGPAVLSNAELLAILIGSGTPDESAVDLMRRILDDCHNSLNALGKMDIPQLCQYKGIGPAKAITIIAACEFGKRRAAEAPAQHPSIKSSQDIYLQMMPMLRDLPHEEAHVLLLNNQLRCIGTRLIGRGGLNKTVVDVRIILREALLAHASAIALCHNHPSGSDKPSRDDDNLTSNVKRGCEAIGVQLIDHVIIANEKYYSYADNGRL